MVALLVVLTILTFVTVDYFVQRRRGQESLAHTSAYARGTLAAVPHARDGYRVPQGVLFHPGHTWLYLEEAGTVRLGIDDLAQSIIGNMDEVVSRAPGEKVRKGDEILHIRHGERTVSFRAPVDGTIEAVNDPVLDREEMLSISPQTDSWIYRIKPEGLSLGDFMIGEASKQWFRRELGRLKVFLSTIASSATPVGQTMQDGGTPVYGLIDHLDDGQWDKLRARFFA